MLGPGRSKYGLADDSKRHTIHTYTPIHRRAFLMHCRDDWKGFGTKFHRWCPAAPALIMRRFEINPTFSTVSVTPSTPVNVCLQRKALFLKTWFPGCGSLNAILSEQRSLYVSQPARYYFAWSLEFGQ
jgi:hypothetical protein